MRNRSRFEKACPRCHGPLHDLHCPSCGVTYPVIAGVPVLVPEPSAHIAQCYVDAFHHLQNGHARLAALEGVGATGEAPNVAFLESTVAALEPFAQKRLVAALALEKRAKAPNPYGDAIRYALRDWSRTETAEAELLGIDRRVRALLPAEPGGRAVVLGAGTGRSGWNLRDRFAELVMVDLSFSMAHAFTRIGEGGVTLADTDLRTDGAPSGAVYELDAGPADARVECWVADATSLPFADGSVDVVCCFYFLDVVRLTTLLAEVRRVLRPTGRFVNLGPLAYHHDDVTEHLPPNEVRRLLRSFDLHIDAASETWETITHLRVNPSPSRPGVHATWAFRADLAERRVSRTTTLRQRWPTQSQLTGPDDVTLFFSNRKAQVAPLQADAVLFFDRGCTVQACLERLGERYELGPADEAQVLAEFDRLRGLGVLEWVE